MDMIPSTAYKSGGVPRNNFNDRPILWGAFVPTKPHRLFWPAGFCVSEV